MEYLSSAMRRMIRVLFLSTAVSFCLSAQSGTLTTVSAASWKGPEAAPGMLATSLGTNLAAQTANAPGGNWPIELAGVSIQLVDSQGRDGYAQIYFVSPNQVNWLVPEWLADGLAKVTLTRSPGGIQAGGTIQVARTAPGLFSANSSGAGVAAAAALAVTSGGDQIPVELLRCGTAPGSCAAVHMDPASGDLIVLLFGTGIRGYQDISAEADGQPLPVLGGGAQGVYAGLDQVNVRIPRSLAGAGEISVMVRTDGRSSNPVTLAVGPAAGRITEVKPASVLRGQRSRVTIAGEGLSRATGLALYPSDGITVSGLSAAEAFATMDLTVASGAWVGQRLVAITGPSGRSNLLPLSVDALPGITSLSPASAQVGQSINLTVTGEYLAGVTALTFSPAAGIAVSNLTASATQVKATVAIASSASAGPRSVTVTSPAGISNAMTFTLAGSRQITSLTPSSGIVGNTVQLVIAGANLEGVTGVVFTPAAGIRITDVVAKAAQVTANLIIDGAAALGERKVSVSSAAEFSNELVFTVLPKPSYDGTWVGTTNQGGRMSFVVKDNNVLMFQSEFTFPNGTKLTVGWGAPIPVTGNRFSLSNPIQMVNGIFESAARANGSHSANLLVFDPVSVTWTASKQ